MEDPTPLDLLRSRMTLRTTAALTQTVADMITAGLLAPGDRLPTVREVAEDCGMSRSAVGEAWRELGARGLIETRRRGGTVVLGKPPTPRALRYESMIRSTVSGVRDLANIRTDGLTYPDLSRAMAWSVTQPRLHEPFAEPITAELEDAVRRTWPFEPERFVTMHGLMDGVELALSLLVKPGDAVIVESPTHGRILDVLEALGARAVAVEYGVEGPDLVALRRALVSKPVAFVYQPTGQMPSGRSVTAGWAEAAAEFLPDTLPILELSQLSLLHPEHVSLGRFRPRQVTQIRSYNLFFGADMRVSVVGGTSELIDAMWMRLTYSTRFVSRLVQGALAFLLTDDASRRELDALCDGVRDRFRLLADALRARGIEVEPSAGPCIWLPVPDDHSVCTRLSQQGIAVHPGRFFQAAPFPEERVHVNSAAVDGDHEEVAELIAAACRPFPVR
ncbi:aminotransferase class I/II-fold pyridoxal phosphate-dependent enzyme [Microbacterium resistens]|uniref:aminotransferase class I/II-fold pyridoxal phosphate-dependent enzyme n=1 Tax=Microbacterium resistens TaxID=156977 RepID=UPI00082CB135|nr:aminotransferase class I/II-fold pyridoxal phosphate-dependent enzyme [Microbacterium resistens]